MASNCRRSRRSSSAAPVLFGGRGTVIGTLGGVLLLGITANLLVMLGVNQFIQGLIQGIIIVAAVALYKQEGD